VVVDGEVAYVSGLCVGQPWEGWPDKGIEGWRDTGVELRGPAVAHVARAFADAWAACGTPLELAPLELAPAGTISVRVVADVSGRAGLYRLDPLVAALARRNLWLADAYYVGTAAYAQALRAAALDGVDVRLLVPGRGSDVAVVQAMSRAGYRPLLEAGIRIFEWDGPMLHSKTAVADGRWSRVGSTNLNLTSWIGNWELDVVVEDEGFGRTMEDAYLADLGHATEIVLTPRRRVRPAAETAPRRRVRGGGGSANRAAAGAMRIGHAVGSALMPWRVHGAAERRLGVQTAVVLLTVAAVAFVWPRLLAWPLAAFATWIAVALLVRPAPKAAGGAQVVAPKERAEPMVEKP
jgi:cardiolipin synthase